MCSVCSGIILNGHPHSVENCPYKNSLRCSRCRKRGHTVKSCPDKHFMRFQSPTFLEQLIPETLRKEYGIETQTLINPSFNEPIHPNLENPKYLEDLICPSDVKTYRIGSRTKLPREQGPPKPLYKPIYEVVNTPSFFRHVVMCHGEQPSQIFENNIGYTLGYAFRQGYDYDQIQQESEIPIKEALKYEQFLLNQMRNYLKRMKEKFRDVNRKEELFREHRTSLKELSEEYHNYGNDQLMLELIKKYEQKLEEAEIRVDGFMERMTTELGINILRSEEELRKCRKQVQELEKKRARKAKLEEARRAKE